MAPAAVAATTATATATAADEESEEETISQTESVRLKNLAEQTYNSSNLTLALKYAKRAHRLNPTLDGVAEMLTAFQILRAAAATTNSAATTPHWYKILEVEPFSHINTIKKQYKKLALILHPDKNTFAASEEAFKLVNEAFCVLSDKIRRKEYDMKLRIAIQTEAEAEAGEVSGGDGGGAVAVDTFWTACSTCRLLHQFEKKYLGHNLMCPSCKKSFKAVQAEDDKVKGKELVDDRAKSGTMGNGRIRTDSNGEKIETRGSDIIRKRSDSKRKMSSVGEIMERSERSRMIERSRNDSIGMNSSGVDSQEGKGSGVRGSERLKEKGKRLNDSDMEEMMTLAEFQKLQKSNEKLQKQKVNEKSQKQQGSEKLGNQKVNERKLKVKLTIDAREEEKDEVQRSEAKSRSSKKKRSGGRKDNDFEIMPVEDSDFYDFDEGRDERNFKKGKNHDLEIMAVEDSDFYDFDKGRVERSFKKGQVWALYDDDDGMPRHYGLIDQVVSTHPFEVNMAWLNPQSNGDEWLDNLEEMGFHISCGRFKVSSKTSVRSLNVFSHVVDCERAAREVYRIYPKKGSVWALYTEESLNVGGGNRFVRDKRCFDIVVFLTSYSEVHGLSMGYLEKVNGFKTIFKRREIGCRAVKWLEKPDVWLFSHQIPARKLSGEETPDLAGDCWELDPASLPPEFLAIDCQK